MTLNVPASITGSVEELGALDGTVVRGPATADQPALDARVQSGKIQVRRRGGRR